MSNNTEWRKLRKFPGYEVSSDWGIRNAITKRTVEQSMSLHDKNRKPKVILIRREHPIEVFVEELVFTEFPEERIKSGFYSHERVLGDFHARQLV